MWTAIYQDVAGLSPIRCTMSSSTDNSRLSSSESSSSETKQISRPSSRLGRSSKTRLQRKSRSRSRSGRTFKSSSKKRRKDRLRSSRSFSGSRSLRSRSPASAWKRRKSPSDPRDFRVRHRSRSVSKMAPSWNWPERHACTSKAPDQTSAAQTYSNPRSVPTTSTNVEKG